MSLDLLASSSRHSCRGFCGGVWQPTPVFLPGESQGWGSLVGCCLWGRTESDMTERLHFPFSLSCIGEGNGNPLQCSWLKNLRDGGAWWAAVYGVTQSPTWLKWLSSSSSRGYAFSFSSFGNFGNGKISVKPNYYVIFPLSVTKLWQGKKKFYFSWDSSCVLLKKNKF